jgi:hypothetical protein
MTNEMAFTVMLIIALFAGFYLIWWTGKQEREQNREHKS